MSIKLDYKNSLRGIRKCPQCGTFNGNRATNCKNRLCDQKLRNEGKSCSPVAPSAVQLAHSNGQMYSLCLQNGVRTFIESSIDLDGTQFWLPVASEKTSTSTKSFNMELIKRVILECRAVANTVPLRKAVVNSLTIPESDKFALWEKYAHSQTIPLVQRVANELFAVGRPQTTYGLCHVVAVKRNQKVSQLHCDCQQKAASVVCWHKLAVVAGLLSGPETYDERWKPYLQQFVGETTIIQECHHSELECTYDSVPPIEGQMLTKPFPVAGPHIEMMDCILNPAIMEFFNDDDDAQPALVSLDALIDMPIDGPIFELAIDNTKTDSVSSVPSNTDVLTTDAESLHLMDCQIELMDEFDLTDRIDFCPSDIECDESMLLPASVIENLSTERKLQATKKDKLVEVTAKKSALRQCGRVEKEKLTRGSYSVRKLMLALESNGVVFNLMQRSGSDTIDKSSGVPPYEATLCNLSFTRWLEAVIEQLNAIIDYNGDGKPAVQTFRIQEDFYRCLRARFSVGHHLRQPVETHTPESGKPPDAPGQPSQLFRFTHHKSLLHVFRTDRMQLFFERSFIRTANDRFMAIEHPEDSKKNEAKNSSPSNGPAIRPQRYSTYIKMGRYKHEPDPDRVYYFSIEWTGGVLPRSGFGDLRISFEYGHRMNNQYVLSPEAVVDTI